MAGQEDILWGLYQEQTTHGRHQESQRATAANLVIAIIAGIFTLILLDKRIDTADYEYFLAIGIVGLFGLIVTAKHSERFDLHMARARQYRDELDRTLFGSDKLKKLKQDGDDAHDGESYVLRHI